MFAVDHVLVSDRVLGTAFACDLGRCLGACCVQGDRGAPLEAHERDELDAVLPIVADRLQPEARATIERQGTWIQDEPGIYSTSTVGDRECVFVTYEGSGPHAVATCAIQRAFQEGRTSFEKPISCHLFPLRVERHGTGSDAIEVLNYEPAEPCSPAIAHGCRTQTLLVDFLERPLSRRYGLSWYHRFRAAVRERRQDLDVAGAHRNSPDVSA